MPGIFSVKSNVKRWLRSAFPSERQRVARMDAALKKIGRMYVARIQRKYMSGRPGLNRVTGLLIRTWYHNTFGRRLDNLKLLVWTPTYYAIPHADAPELLKGTPRRFPARLLVVKEWKEVTQRDGIADATLSKGYM